MSNNNWDTADIESGQMGGYAGGDGGVQTHFVINFGYVKLS